MIEYSIGFRAVAEFCSGRSFVGHLEVPSEVAQTADALPRS